MAPRPSSPPSAVSWLNAVETFFSALTFRRLTRGAFCSVTELQSNINRYIHGHNDDPKTFKPASAILADQPHPRTFRMSQRTGCAVPACRG